MQNDRQYLFTPGTQVRHFKRDLISITDIVKEPYMYKYIIIGVAIHHDTEEPLMVYKALYGNGTMYARPLDDFFAKVDKTKYPNARQDYCFVPDET